MENRDWKIFKNDMHIKAPVSCSSMNDDNNGLVITYENDDHQENGIKIARVIIHFDSERVFATRKRTIINCDKLVSEIDRSEGWIFYSKNSIFMDTLKKDMLYDDDDNDYTHYMFVSYTEIIDVISTKPPTVEEFVGVE